MDGQQYLFQLVLTTSTKSLTPADPHTKKRHFSLLKHDVCRAGFEQCLGVGNKRVTGIEKAIDSGCTAPFEDLRHLNYGNEANLKKELDVDSFFLFLYTFLAETMANEDEQCQELMLQDLSLYAQEWLQARDGNPLAIASSGLQAAVDLRQLPPMSWGQLYAYYQTWTPNEEDRGKRSCFDEVYRKKWSHLIKIRNEGQHDRCETCAKLTKTFKEDPEKKNRDAARQAYDKHLDRMHNDRRLDARLTRLSEISCGLGCTFRGVLHLRVDGMDQAKFKCPRNMENSKSWSSLWRPTLHCAGVLVEGVCECFFLMDPDIPKDSNMECTIICLALDKAYKILQSKGIAMPDHCSIKYDNTAREGKNQTFAKFQSWLQFRGKFQSVQDGNAEKGHTHDGLDQRFSVGATVLSNEPLLEDPEAFKQSLLAGVVPCRGRELFVEVLDGIWDWQKFFEPLEISYSGIAASQHHLDVCHSKRFLSRRDVGLMKLPGWELITPSVFEKCEVDGSDVVMCTKQWWSDNVLSQPPIVVLPAEVAKKLSHGPDTIKCRNKLSDRSVREFRKTACEVNKKPWAMGRAANYLNTWVENNIGSVFPAPPALGWVLQEVSQELADLQRSQKPAYDEWSRYAPQQPVKIEVSKTKVPKQKYDSVEPIVVEKQVAMPDGSVEAIMVAEEPAGDGKKRKAGPVPIAAAAKAASKKAKANVVGGDSVPPVAKAAAKTLGRPKGLHPVADADAEALVLGCFKCRGADSGCTQCRSPSFHGKRGPLCKTIKEKKKPKSG